jgi:benzodiazapine receptor
MTREYTWYAQLKKPSWAPPSWLFGPVWTVLYIIIAISFGTVFYNAYTGVLPAIVALPFALNLLFNALFTPLQFRLKSNLLASIDIILVWVTLAASLYVAYVIPGLAWVALVNIPYLLWVTFASVLQFTITGLNWKK